MTLQAVADGLEARLATITGLRVFDHVPDVFAVPCAFVLPQTVDYHGAFAGGLVEQGWTVTVVVGRASDRAGQRSLLAYMAPAGTGSVRAAIEGDETLDGAASSTIVRDAGNIRILSQGDADYLAADWSVTVFGTFG